ncbi:MAG: hypothetical protein JEY94_01920 [Melioribacteraceae bacterium]|nr:hypothetical protein [Melioribacteraceae bacterium]
MKNHGLLYTGVILLLLNISVVLAGAIIIRFEAQSTGDDIVVTWESSSESEVDHYNVLRGTSMDGEFTTIHEEKSKGFGYTYIFNDNSAYKSSNSGSFYCYKLEIILTDGSKAEVKAISVTHDKVSTTKKTWGSIKALFR